MDIEQRIASQQARECRAKVRHDSEEAATAEAQRFGREVDGDLIAYHCIWCRGWHVGSRRS